MSTQGSAIVASATTETDLFELRTSAHDLRVAILEMAAGKGEGYVAQGLGMADCLAALYFAEMKYDPSNPSWPERDRFLMSTGHYSIAMYAVLANAGYFDPGELPTYGLNGSRLPMSTFDDLPGIEIVGGSLGQGLGQVVGMALGLRLDGRDARVFCEVSDLCLLARDITAGVGQACCKDRIDLYDRGVPIFKYSHRFCTDVRTDLIFSTLLVLHIGVRPEPSCHADGKSYEQYGCGTPP